MRKLVWLCCAALFALGSFAHAQDDRSIVKAYKTVGQPTIDGIVEAGEWDAAGPWISVTQDSPHAQLGDDENDADVYGGDEDASYRFKLMWEEDTFNFFILYEVFDDIAATEEPRENRIWERDQMETFIDGTSLEGDDDPDSYHWWDNDETYGKFGVNRDNLFEGNTGKMTDDQELWNDFNLNAPLLSVAQTGETGTAANYYIEMGVTLEAMWEDFNFLPFENTPTDEAGHIVEDSTTIKFTNAMSDDDDFDHEGTDRSTTLTYYREIDGVAGQWDQSNYYADILFTGEFDGVIIDPVVGDCNEDGSLTTADLSCQTAELLAGTLLELRILPGDFDANGKVEFADFLTLADNFGQPGNYTTGDADGNGVIEFSDFLAVAENFGKTFGEANVSSVPEPGAEFLLAAGGLLFGLWRRRR